MVQMGVPVRGWEMVRVFLVDDHELVRRGVAGVLEAQSDLEIVGEAANCRDAAARISATLPDVAILDVQLPDGSGIDLCRHIRQEHPEVSCLILTAYDDEDAIMAAVMADAAGYVLKSLRMDELVTAVRFVSQGRRLLNATLRTHATDQMRSASPDDPRFGSLSLRERQILALIADALTNRQIGERLGLAEKTVKNYVSSLLRKLGLEHRTQAAVFELDRLNSTN
jgi:DNA-binding NarL/FixJ family response regulator